jgi:hypothetical protein
MKNDHFRELATELVRHLASFRSNPIFLGRNVAKFSLDFDGMLPAITLRIVTNVPVPSTTLHDDEDALVQNEIALDCDTIPTQTDGVEMLETEVLIMLHPVYQIPSPYIMRSRWVGSGQILSISQFQNEVDSLHKSATTLVEHSGDITIPELSTREPADNRTYAFGRLTQDNHPVTDEPCWSMHMCMLEDIMRMSFVGEGRGGGTSEAEAWSSDSATKPPHTGVERLYLLNWLSLVGPHFGLAMAPEAYRAISAAILL